MSAKILQGDVFEMLPTIAPRSVDCCVFSPPYWSLRQYLPQDHPLKPLEIGCEKTPQEYVAKMVRVMHLVRECLADHGTVWLNVGDTYARESGDDDGNLCLVPQRLALALQEDGWIIRSIPIWHKPAPMPSSVSGWRWMRCRVKVKDKSGNKAKQTEWKDCPGCKKCNPGDGFVLRKGCWRPTSSYEPILMLAKSLDYFCDGEAVKTPAAEATLSRNEYTRILDDPDEQFAVKHDHECLVTTANLRDVWTIGHEPLDVKHYAAYPTELVRKCLLAGTSSHGYCTACGLPWVRVINYKAVPHPEPRAKGRDEIDNKGGNQANGSVSLAPEIETIGWRPSCKCELAEALAGPRAGLVLDPFSGSGRTGITAGRLGLDYVGIELHPDFVTMSEEKLHEDMPLFV